MLVVTQVVCLIFDNFQAAIGSNIIKLFLSILQNHCPISQNIQFHLNQC